MALLFLGTTILLAHLVFVTQYSPMGVLLQQLKVSAFVAWSLRYLLPAVIVAAALHVSKLPLRLPERMRGRYLLASGVAISAIVFTLRGLVLDLYRPGLGVFPLVAFKASLYADDLARLLIFAGIWRALLCARPASPSDLPSRSFQQTA